MNAICFSKTIGIIGGAGPMASSCLYRKILDICQREYGSNDYNEFPQIILISYPFIRGNPEKIQEDLALCLAKLKDAGAFVVCVASHSFHGYLPDIAGVTFVHIVNESVSEAAATNISRALVLSAQTTRDLKLYEQKGLLCVYPNKAEQKEVSRIIREVAGGVVSAGQADSLNKMIIRAGPVDGVVLACTELPVVHEAFPLSEDLPIIDATEVLARRLIELAR